MTQVFNGENFNVQLVDRVVRGVNQQYEVVVRPEIVLCVPVTLGGHMLLVRQHRVAVDDAVLEFPAGRVDAGENLDDAARRELLEEMGFLVTRLERIGSLLTAPHFSNERTAVYIVHGSIESIPRPTVKEDLYGILEADADHIESLIATGELIDSKSIAAYALVRPHLKRYLSHDR